MSPSSSVFPGAVTQLPEEGEKSAAQASHQQQVGQDEEAEIHNLEMIVIIIVTIITVITSRLSRGDFPAALFMEANSFCLGFISIPDCGVEEAR